MCVTDMRVHVPGDDTEEIMKCRKEERQFIIIIIIIL